MPLGSKGKKPTAAEKTRRVREVYSLQTPLHDTKFFNTPQKTGMSAFALLTNTSKRRGFKSRRTVRCPARPSSVSAWPASALTRQWLPSGQLQVATNSVRLQAELDGFDWQISMTTELTNLPCGTVQIRVCEDNICATGWVSSHHLVPTKEEQLKQRLRQDAAEAFAEADCA